MLQHQAPRWLAGGHAQTIWPALFSRRYSGPQPRYRRERWSTPDGDFVDADWQDAPATAPLLVLFHGLEGSSSSHYAQSFAYWARVQGWRFVVPHFRGCSGELNWAPRAYHSGDHAEIAWMLQRARAAHAGPMVALGVSLGGSALLNWAARVEQGEAHGVLALCAVSAPLDLSASGHAMGRGLNRQIYTRMFLRTMKPKALRKWAQHPGLFDREALAAAQDLHAFDNVFTAPLHGFQNTQDYWRRASSKPHLSRIGLPALVVNALNDPFVPKACLPEPQETGSHVKLWQPAHGGHVGFSSGRWPGHLQALPEAVMRWAQLATGLTV
jgi:uncharacterized protein